MGLRFLLILSVIFFAQPLKAFDGKSSNSFKEQGGLSLEKALQLALLNSPAIKKSLLEIDISKLEHKKALSMFFPRIDSRLEYTGGDSPSSYLFKKIDERKLPGNTDFNHPGRFDNFEAGISAVMNIYNGGKSRSLIRAYKKGIKSKKLFHEDVKNHLAFSIISLWYDLLSALDLVGIAENSVSSVSEQVRIKNVQFLGGTALKSDLLSLKARLSQAKEELLSAHTKVRIIKTELAWKMGIDPLIDFQIENKDFKIDISLCDLGGKKIETAFENHPVFLASLENIKACELKVEKERAGLFPKLDLKLDYHTGDEDMQFSKSRENWQAGIYASLNLFNGFATKADIEKAIKRLEIEHENKRQVIIELKKEIKKALLNLELAVERESVSKERKNEAEASFKLVKKQYSGGSVSITRFLESELSMNRAMASERVSFYEKKKAKAFVLKSTGTLFKELMQNQIKFKVNGDLNENL